MHTQWCILVMMIMHASLNTMMNMHDDSLICKQWWIYMNVQSSVWIVMHTVVKSIVITYTFCSWATMMQHTDLSLFLFWAILHGVLAWILTTSVFPEPCSSDFPCKDCDSGVHWNAFSDDIVHCSRPVDQSWYIQL